MSSRFLDLLRDSKLGTESRSRPSPSDDTLSRQTTSIDRVRASALPSRHASYAVTADGLPPTAELANRISVTQFSPVRGNQTPLMLAAAANAAPLVRALLEAQASVNARTPVIGASALHFAAAAGHTSTVALLLAARADPGFETKREYRHAGHTRRAAPDAAPSLILARTKYPGGAGAVGPELPAECKAAAAASATAAAAAHSNNFNNDNNTNNVYDLTRDTAQQSSPSPACAGVGAGVDDEDNNDFTASPFTRNSRTFSSRHASLTAGATYAAMHLKTTAAAAASATAAAVGMGLCTGAVGSKSSISSSSRGGSAATVTSSSASAAAVAVSVPAPAATATARGGLTALHLACAHGHPRVAALLVAAGAPARALDGAGFTPADWARRAGHGAVLSALDKAAQAAAAQAATAAARAAGKAGAARTGAAGATLQQQQQQQQGQDGGGGSVSEAEVRKSKKAAKRAARRRARVAAAEGYDDGLFYLSDNDDGDDSDIEGDYDDESRDELVEASSQTLGFGSADPAVAAAAWGQLGRSLAALERDIARGQLSGDAAWWLSPAEEEGLMGQVREAVAERAHAAALRARGAPNHAQADAARMRGWTAEETAAQQKREDAQAWVQEQTGSSKLDEAPGDDLWFP